MPRPRKGSDQDLEKTLTRTVCQHVYLQSGRTHAELEEVFSIGGLDGFGHRTGRTFSRYCESDPKKSRAATRETLARLVQKAAQNNWISADVIRHWGLHRVLALNLDHKEVELYFDQRRAERDGLATSLRELRQACANASDALARVRHVAPAQSANGPHSEQIGRLHDLHVVTGINDPANEFYQVRPPASVTEALSWLQVHLDRAVLVMRDGFGADPRQEVDRRLLQAHRPAPQQRSPSRVIASPSCDTADIDQLLAEVEKWCNSGAPVTKSEAK